VNNFKKYNTIVWEAKEKNKALVRRFLEAQARGEVDTVKEMMALFLKHRNEVVVRRSRYELDQAEKQLQDSRLEAPFNGRVEERFVRPGELISPGMPVVRLVNTDYVRITAGIPERYSGQISENSPVYIRFRSYDGSIVQSTISFAGNVIDSSTRTFPVEIELRNREGNIKPEMVVDLQVKRRTIQNAIVIPRTAIVRDEQGISVYVAREEDGEKIAELVPVTTGPALGTVIEILDGLQEGDEVVIAGMNTLSSGDRLNVIKSAESNDKARELQLRDRPMTSF
jgi:membrane fusion protein, multidrug efflux system